jgi:hypothetical protein
MLVVWAPKGGTDSLGQFVDRQQPVGFYHLALAMNPLRFYRIEPWALFFGSRQLMILTPLPPFLTSLL